MFRNATAPRCPDCGKEATRDDDYKWYCPRGHGWHKIASPMIASTPAHKAIRLLERQVQDHYALSPELREAITTLSAALNERDALHKALEPIKCLSSFSPPTLEPEGTSV